MTKGLASCPTVGDRFSRTVFMAHFRYEISEGGVDLTATIEARDETEALARLRAIGLSPGGVTRLAPPVPLATDPIWSEEPPPTPRSGRAGPWSFTILFGLPFLIIGLGVSLADLPSIHLSSILFGGLFVLIGGSLSGSGFRRWSRWHKLVRFGRHVRGHVTTTGFDTRVKINGRPAYKLGYTYEVRGESYDGSVSTFNAKVTEFVEGDPIWVLHDQANPERSTSWPAYRPY